MRTRRRNATMSDAWPRTLVARLLLAATLLAGVAFAENLERMESAAVAVQNAFQKYLATESGGPVGANAYSQYRLVDNQPGQPPTYQLQTPPNHIAAALPQQQQQHVYSAPGATATIYQAAGATAAGGQPMRYGVQPAAAAPSPVVAAHHQLQPTQFHQQQPSQFHHQNPAAFSTVYAGQHQFVAPASSGPTASSALPQHLPFVPNAAAAQTFAGTFANAFANTLSSYQTQGTIEAASHNSVAAPAAVVQPSAPPQQPTDPVVTQIDQENLAKYSQYLEILQQHYGIRLPGDVTAPGTPAPTTPPQDIYRPQSYVTAAPPTPQIIAAPVTTQQPNVAAAIGDGMTSQASIADILAQHQQQWRQQHLMEMQQLQQQREAERQTFLQRERELQVQQQQLLQQHQVLHQQLVALQHAAAGLSTPDQSATSSDTDHFVTSPPMSPPPHPFSSKFQGSAVVEHVRTLPPNIQPPPPSSQNGNSIGGRTPFSGMPADRVVPQIHNIVTPSSSSSSSNSAVFPAPGGSPTIPSSMTVVTGNANRVVVPPRPTVTKPPPSAGRPDPFGDKPRVVTSAEKTTENSKPTGEIGQASTIQALTQQIRRLPAVLYVDSRSDTATKIEALLRDTYGLPLVAFYVDKVERPAQVRKQLHQLTAHDGLPYLFICGTFIGSEQHIENYHKNGQIPQLVEYVCGDEKRSKKSKLVTSKVVAKKTTQ